MTRTIRRLWWRLLWKTEESHVVLRVKDQLYVSPATAAMLRANLPASAVTRLPELGDFVIVETPYMAQYRRVLRFPRLAALVRRLT